MLSQRIQQIQQDFDLLARNNRRSENSGPMQFEQANKIINDIRRLRVSHGAELSRAHDEALKLNLLEQNAKRYVNKYKNVAISFGLGVFAISLAHYLAFGKDPVSVEDDNLIGSSTPFIRRTLMLVCCFFIYNSYRLNRKPVEMAHPAEGGFFSPLEGRGIAEFKDSKADSSLTIRKGNA